MLIRIYLVLSVFALLLLVLADVAAKLAFPMLPDGLTSAGLVLLLAATGLWLVLGAWTVIQRIYAALAAYFSETQRVQRRLLFTESQQQALNLLMASRRLQIHYFSEFKRKRLLRANDRQHIHALSKAIARQLHANKAQLSPVMIRQWQQENSHFRNRLDAAGLISLQQKITAAIQS